MVRKLITITISLLLLSACATTSENQTDENISSNEKVINNSVEEGVVNETASEEVIEPTNSVKESPVVTAEDSDMNSDEGSASHELSEPPEANKKTQVTEKQDPEEHAKVHSEKGLGNHIFSNGPTKQVIKSLEGVTDALNVMTFGIFASGARPAQ